MGALDLRIYGDTKAPDACRQFVISVGLSLHSRDEEFWDGMDESTLSRTKEMLDDMHKRKLDMAYSVYVINVGGYIGDNTRSEIVYERLLRKEIWYWRCFFRIHVVKERIHGKEH